MKMPPLPLNHIEISVISPGKLWIKQLILCSLCPQVALSAASNAWEGSHTRHSLPPSCSTLEWLYSAAADTRPCPAPSPSCRTTLRWCGALSTRWTSLPCELKQKGCSHWKQIQLQKITKAKVREM